MYESYGMVTAARGVDWRMVVWVKRGTLRWIRHMRMDDHFIKIMYEGSIEGGGIRG